MSNKRAVASLLANAAAQIGYGAKSEVARRTGVTPQTVVKWTDVERPTYPREALHGHIEAALSLEPGAIRAAYESADDPGELAAVAERLTELSGTVERLAQRVEALEAELADRAPHAD